MYVHRIYDKSDAVTTFVTVMNYQICDAHSAASYMCIVHLSCGKYMCKDICVCVCTTFCCCWRQYLLVRRRFFWKYEILSNRIECILYFVQCLSRRACLSYPYVHFFCWDRFTIPKSPSAHPIYVRYKVHHRFSELLPTDIFCSCLKRFLLENFLWTL